MVQSHELQQVGDFLRGAQLAEKRQCIFEDTVFFFNQIARPRPENSHQQRDHGGPCAQDGIDVGCRHVFLTEHVVKKPEVVQAFGNLERLAPPLRFGSGKEVGPALAVFQFEFGIAQFSQRSAKRDPLRLVFH